MKHNELLNYTAPYDGLYGVFRFLPFVMVLGVLGACTTTSETATSGYREIPSEGTVLHQDYQDVRRQVFPLINKVRNKYNIKGISLALVDGQDVVWAEGFGYADVANGIPATPTTVYRAGSIAKPLTATAVMQLAEKDVIDIDQPLFTYLPQFSIRSRFNTKAEPITIRSILCHHSGLPSDLNKGMWSSDSFTSVAALLGEEYTAYPPNLLFSYSNVGYTLLGHMLQEVTREEFTGHMERRLLRPLGMHQTAFTLRPDLKPHLAKGYRKNVESGLLPIRDLPAHSLYSTVLDLSRFVRMVLADGLVHGKKILDPETIREMLEVQNDDVPLDLSVRNGLGWFLEEDSILGAGYVVRHGGTAMVFASEMIILPEHRLGVVILANSKGSRPVVSRLAEEVLQMVLDIREEDRPPPTGRYLAELIESPKEFASAVPGGRYATDFGLIAIRPEDEEICACVIEKTLDLIPQPNGWFGVPVEAMDSLPPTYRLFGKLRFTARVIDGREVIVARQGNKEVLLGEKVPQTVVPQAWLRRVGRYELLNPDEGFPLEEPEVLYEQGTLGMSYRIPKLMEQTIRVPLRPISDTEAVILGLGRMRGETLRAIMVDGEEHLRYSGYIGRKVGE